MSRRTTKPDTIKTLADWAARWPEISNLGFDPETREPTVYTATKERTKVSSIPWKREADTLTVLTNPTQYSSQAVAAAESRYSKIREQRDQMRQAGEVQLRLAEGTLLDAWRMYNATKAANPSASGPLRRDIISAERALRDLEGSLAIKGRMVVQFSKGVMPNGSNVSLQELDPTDYVGTEVPPMPVSRRGISLVDTV